MKHFEIPPDSHSTLNPVLWDGEQLKPDVKNTLVKIAKAYYKFLKLNVKVIDVVVSGSQANFNYSPHSDIDLHLIVDYSTVQCDMDVDELFDTKRKLWKEQHDINIHGIDVELYVEDSNKPAVSSTYSIVKNEWIKAPKQVKTDPNQAKIERLCTAWIILFKEAISTHNIDAIREAKDLLWQYRKAGLDKEGEMGTANLVFKALRNNGVTEIVLDILRYLEDQNLSLENQPLN